ncbi:MAG TPA: serine/threonine-protein kinase [Gemmatimonadales bacterium]|jgi:Serine/threonine protein kinase
MTSSDPAGLPRLAAIVDQAFTLDAVQRSAFLDQACIGEPALRAQVERLLAGDAMAFLDSPAAALGAPLVASAYPPIDDPLLDTTVGPYLVLERLGAGGMGAVYLAERADGQFRQRVVLKLIKRGMDSEEIHRRFLAERQILARLSHPCVARLLDGGVTTDGRPWFAMEYVDGEAITAHCARTRLGVAERVRLFEDVCRAVRYAHQNLVVHRDLKPSNILVTADGQVKLLDFGIAKLLHEATGDETLTRAGTQVMTPEYAAPEQVRGEAVTTATDVYALGAVLYEVLTGLRAQPLERAAFTEIERVVCTVAPEAPSTAVARAFPTERDRGRELRGDLDTIALKALQKEPRRRYPSADALLADLERYREGLPVNARPDSRLYRAGKFATRHRGGVAATLAVFAALIGGLAVAARQATVARREATTATEVKNFVKGLFSVATPTESRGRQVTAAELVERGTRQVDSALARQPAVQLELLHFLGEVNRDLGLFPRAESLFQRSTNLARRLYGADGLAEAKELAGWATVKFFQGEYPRAASLQRSALDIRRRRGADDSTVGANLSDLAFTLQYQGAYAEAESLFLQSLAISRRLYGEHHLETATDLAHLGDVRWQARDVAGADSVLREALAIRRALLDLDHPLVLGTMHSLAGVLQAQGMLADAESLQRRVVEDERRVYRGAHPELATALQQLDQILEDRGKYAEAESVLVEALAVRRRFLAVDHPETRALQANLGVLRYRMGDLRGAEAATREALRSDERSLGPDHPTTLTIRQNLGAILTGLGRTAEAEPLLLAALEGRRRALGDSTSDVGQTLRNVGVLRARQRRWADAERAYRDAIAIERRTLGAEHPWIAQAKSGLGAVLVAQGRPAEAEPILQEGLAVQGAQHGPHDPRTLETMNVLGACLAARGRLVEAESLLVESVRFLRENPYSGKELPDAERRLASFRSAQRGAHRAAP